MKTFCQHDECREETSAEVAFMAFHLRRLDLHDLSERVHRMTVRCRLEGKPRPGIVGGVPASLPPRRSNRQ